MKQGALLWFMYYFFCKYSSRKSQTASEFLKNSEEIWFLRSESEFFKGCNKILKEFRLSSSNRQADKNSTVYLWAKSKVAIFYFCAHSNYWCLFFWRFLQLSWQFSEKQNWQYIEFTMNHLPVRTVAAYIGFVITVSC